MHRIIAKTSQPLFSVVIIQGQCLHVIIKALRMLKSGPSKTQTVFQLIQSLMFFSPYSPFDCSFLRVCGSWLGLGGPDLRAFHLGVPPQSRLCHDHPPACTKIPYVVTQAARLQPQQQLRPPEQQQLGQRSL